MEFPLQWLYVDLNSYFASVEQQLCPDLRGEPVIVVPVMTDATSAIAASYEAKALGIRTGTGVGEAKKMCPGIKIVLARHQEYVKFHERIHGAIDNIIQVADICSIDEFACELQGKQRTPEGAREVAMNIKAAMKKEIGAHVKASIGCAPNKYLAKIACDLEKPDGLTLLTPEDIPGKLMGLKPRDLTGIGHNMAHRLKEAGVTTFEQLWALQPKQMRAIWGSVAGERMWYWLRGHNIPHWQTGEHSSIGHSHVLAPPWRPVKRAETVARRLLLKAASRLRRMGFEARYLDLSVRTLDHGRFGFRAQFDAACDNHTFVQAFAPMWAALLREIGPKAKIKKIGLTLHGLDPKGTAQPTLFTAIEAGNPHRREKAAVAMDVLNARYGRDTVVMGFLPKESTQFSGTRIAFSRVPEMEEFHE